ncbi:MAG: chemotaxis response regulator protein-glutamate methylesterase [Myxococcota bacterium]
MERIRVLVVDDSTVVRRIVAKVLGDDPRLEVVDTALNGKAALDKIEKLRPDLVTLDLEMPVMNGLETLAELRTRRIDVPVIVFSAADQAGAVGALEALQAGAADYVTKPSQLARIADAVSMLQAELIPKIIAIMQSIEHRESVRVETKPRPVIELASSPPPRRVVSSSGSAPQLVVIGTSTGGPKALQAILPNLSASFPVPVLIVQHMPPTFTTTLARSLDQRCRLRVAEAFEGAEARPGEVWIAPGDFHMTVERTARGCRLHLDQGPKENSCRPAVDPLFRSAAKAFGARTLAIVLTGMGSDGLDGARALRQTGARVAVQDEGTSVVWGMPGAVASAGLADQVLPQDEVALYLERSVVTRPFREGATSR